MTNTPDQPQRIIRSTAHRERRSNLIKWVILEILILGGVYYFFFYKHNKEVEQKTLIQVPPQSEIRIKKNVQQKIQQNLQAIQFKHKLAQDEIAQKKDQYNQTDYQTDPSKNLDASSGLEQDISLEQEDLFSDILTTIRKNFSQGEYYEDIEDRVERYKLVEDKVKSIRSIVGPDEEDLYVENLLKKVREEGYEVKLNDDLQIISIKKIRKR